MSLEDLDMALMKVREPQSRQYMSDAIKAYRAGAYRPAISAAWVALAFDLIQKYRELAALGDAEATSFIANWDNAVTHDDRKKLLKMEGEILEHAHSKMNMFNSSGLKSLERLREDRHTSAHPAFVSIDELYEPSDEQTRAHLKAAISIVLSQRPVRGRGIIDAFGADLVSPGFPTSNEAALNYVDQKYLAHMRPSAIQNFGVVLAKSALMENVDEWIPHNPKVILALVTIQQRRTADWPAVEAAIVRLINDDTPAHRSNALMLIGWFPGLLSGIAESTRDALTEHCRSGTSMLERPRSFFAVGVEWFEREVCRTFEQLTVDEKSAVVGVAPMPAFWESSLQAFASARSFRSAEHLFDTMIAPFFGRLQQPALDQVFVAAANNGQIWASSGVPSRLISMLEYSGILPSWAAIDQLYVATRYGASIDPMLFTRLEAAGWPRSQPEPPQ